MEPIEDRGRHPQGVPLLQLDPAPAVAICRAVSERVHSSKQSFVHIEEIQDMVQEELMKSGHFKVAEAYILYRALQAARAAAGSRRRGRLPGRSPSSRPP